MTILLQLFVLFGSALTVGYGYLKNRSYLKRFGWILLGVFLFEFSTQVLWINEGLWRFTYVAYDRIGPHLNWLISLGWTLIVFYAWLLVDRFDLSKEWKRFTYRLVAVTVISILAEGVVLNLGIRSYGPEVQQLLSGYKIPALGVPIEALYYVPAFMALVLGFVSFLSGEGLVHE